MVDGFRTGSHTRYKLEVHIAGATKYRHNILKNDVAIRCRDLLKRICTEFDVHILKGTVSVDHVHMVLSYPPDVSISKLVQNLKGKSSRLLQIEFPHLGKKYWGQRMWVRGYFAVSTGNVTKEMIKEYLEHHFEDPESADQTFRIE